MFTIVEPVPPAVKPAPAPADRNHFVIVGERLNISADGKRFKAFFMTPGVVNYEDVPDGGQELLRKPTIDAALDSLIGDPLTIGHVKTTVTDTTNIANGKVDKAYFDPESGWYCCEGPVDTDQARQHIKEGWGVSVGTRVLEFGAPGHWLNNPYDREITKLRFHHLALVDPSKKPRFEDATIRLNSTHRPMSLKWIRKLLGNAGEQPREETSDLPHDTKIDVGEGKTATIGELVALEHAATAAERANHCHALGADDYIEHEGVRYHVGTLVKHYHGASKLPAGGKELPNTAAGARAEVEDAELALHLADREVSEAKKLAEADGATDEHKKHHAEKVASHASAVDRHNKAVQHHASFMTRPNTAVEAQTAVVDALAAAAAAKTAAEAAKVEADRENATTEIKSKAEKLAVTAAVSARLAADAQALLDGIVARDNAAEAAKVATPPAAAAQPTEAEIKAKAEKDRLEAEQRAQETERLHAAELQKERENARARGAAAFEILGTARETASTRVAAPSPMTGTLQAKLERGRQLYGSGSAGNN